jgi:hypothetical protein
MKIHRLLSSLQNGLTKRSSSYTIRYVSTKVCWWPSEGCVARFDGGLVKVC